MLLDLRSIADVLTFVPGAMPGTGEAIIPAAVGVDLGCGMVAARTTLTSSQLPDSLRGLRTATSPVDRICALSAAKAGSSWDPRSPFRTKLRALS